uniref:Uncharacterized protein n=1 Tax=Arundo donax TaxID=35708 RepID=A0A0A9FLH6_ARUDO
MGLSPVVPLRRGDQRSSRG